MKAENVNMEGEFEQIHLMEILKATIEYLKEMPIIWFFLVMREVKERIKENGGDYDCFSFMEMVPMILRQIYNTQKVSYNNKENKLVGHYKIDQWWKQKKWQKWIADFGNKADGYVAQTMNEVNN